MQPNINTMNRLTTYYNLKNETIDYNVGDTIILKQGYEIFKSNSFYDKNIPSYGIVLELNDDQVAFITYDCIINNRPSYWYKKGEFNCSNQLLQFIQDTSIDKNVLPSTFVRPRIHINVIDYCNKLLDPPFLIIKNDCGKITIACDLESKIIQIEVMWYQLSLYK